MNQIKIKLIFFTILSLFISNCSNLNSTFINADTKRIDKYNKDGKLLQSYYKIYNKDLNYWYPAECLANDSKCQHTRLSLFQIKNAKENNLRDDIYNYQVKSIKDQNRIDDNKENSTNNQNQNQNLDQYQDPNFGITQPNEIMECEGGYNRC